MADDDIVPNMQEVIIARSEGTQTVYSSGNTRDPMIEVNLPRAMLVENSTIVGTCLTDRGHRLSRTADTRNAAAIAHNGLIMDVGEGTLTTNATIAQIRQCAVDNNIAAEAWNTQPVQERPPRALLRDMPLRRF